VDLLSHGLQIINAAEQRGIHLRLFGSAAVLLRCGYRDRISLLYTRVPRDLDFVCNQGGRKELGVLLAELGYECNRQLMIATEGRRWTLAAPGRPESIDVFFDEIEFCHRLNLRNRIAIDSETITLADLFLSKLQYVEPQEENVEDMVCLLKSHRLGQRDGEVINVERICEVLSSSWGYYHTAVINLDRICRRLTTVSRPDGSTVATREKLLHLRQVVTNWPKGLLWKLRGVIGPRMKWYKEVESIEIF
jgi:hypothetical protein